MKCDVLIHEAGDEKIAVIVVCVVVQFEGMLARGASPGQQVRLQLFLQKVVDAALVYAQWQQRRAVFYQRTTVIGAPGAGVFAQKPLNALSPQAQAMGEQMGANAEAER